MRLQKNRKRLYRFSIFVSGTAIFVMAILGAILAVDLDKESAPAGYLADAIGFIQSWGWIALLTLGPLSGLTQLVSIWVGRPRVWRTIEGVLDVLKESAFIDDCNDDPSHYHRVTLFQHMKRKFWILPWRGSTPWGGSRTPFSGWLVPVARSGHTTQRSATVFLAPDDADNAEGVAGQTWNNAVIVSHNSLPELTKTSSDADVIEYARKTGTSLESNRKRLGSGASTPAAMVGIPVFVDGRPWGVIILDSRKPNGIKSAEDNAVAFKIAQSLLEKLLEKG